MAALPDVTTIEQHMRDGWTTKQIADHYGVSDSAVYKKMARAGKMGNRPRIHDELPWDVLEKHQSSSIYANLRTLHRIGLGEPVRPGDLRRAQAMVKRLTDERLVIAYDPGGLPNKDSTVGGFWFTPRRKGDFELVQNPEV